jgi:hypothetical protein
MARPRKAHLQQQHGHMENMGVGRTYLLPMRINVTLFQHHIHSIKLAVWNVQSNGFNSFLMEHLRRMNQAVIG